ncbi:FadR/GntR family transcriptional regulator [Paraburkholderia sp. HD33-4]|uniref:FadR/GntR family transcriptional regulator n=1 Tax=Paraburkholderia sp. HD33-4 TaxID=2883242 RepID=UPI001F41C996|nr:FCD domain-containing protein [Paraburkholderia sp. HD33-4]
MEDTLDDVDLLTKLKRHLIGAGLKPGDKIETETELAARFGVSRHHVRQVLAVMVQAGILDRAPRRGTVIRDFDSVTLSDHIRFQFEVAQFDIAEFKEARAVIERAIIPLVVRRITPAQLDKVEETIEKMLENVDHPEVADSYDLAFHLSLLEASGNHVLQAFSGVLSTLFKSADYRRRYWNQERILRIAAEHRALLDAIRMGDTAAAIAALDNHLKSSQIGISS